METCPWCGKPDTHCLCWHREMWIPDEPHIPSSLEAEPNPECPVHFGTEKEETDGPRSNHGTPLGSTEF